MTTSTTRSAALALLAVLSAAVAPGCAEPRIDAPASNDKDLAGPMNPDNSEESTPGTPIPRDAQAERLRDTAGQPAGPSHGAVPKALLDAVIADLSERTGAASADVEILRAMPVTWNDGSLGCPAPGTAYTQALVSGYWIVLGHTSALFSYHATRSRYFILCEKPLDGLPEIPPGARSNAADL